MVPQLDAQYSGGLLQYCSNAVALLASSKVRPTANRRPCAYGNMREICLPADPSAIGGVRSLQLPLGYGGPSCIQLSPMASMTALQAGENPLAGLAPSVPDGVSLAADSEPFRTAEATGLGCALEAGQRFWWQREKRGSSKQRRSR